MRTGAVIMACLGALLLSCTGSVVEPQEPEASQEPGAPEEPGPELRPCGDEVVEAIDTTIAGQLAAFAADDFEAALGFASGSFRAGVDAATFRALILDAYPNLTDDAVHRSGACLLNGDGVAEVRIEVTGDSGTRDDHVYLMVQEDDRWLVEGAVTPDGSDRTVA